MLLKLWTDAPTDRGDVIPAGSIVEYRGHVPGGMVKVYWFGQVGFNVQFERVIHPNTTEELRNSRKVAPLST